jgi:hypothetical protein
MDCSATKELEVSNVLIVESENDKYFVEALIEHWQYANITLNSPICSIDDYECLAGLSAKKLKYSLSLLKNESRKRNIEKIGIILDMDNETESSRIKMVNTAIQESFETDEQLKSVNEFITVDIDGNSQVKIACYFTNVDGKGELETVLKAIKSKPSIYADCLTNWKDCIETAGQKLTDKDFDKFWISIYQRFDCCSKREKYQANRKCSNEASMKKAIYNFDSPILDDFKQFLGLFL